MYGKETRLADTSMLIQILSDLHVEFDGNLIPALAPDAELIILAGDLAPVHTRRVGTSPNDGPVPTASFTCPGTTSSTGPTSKWRDANSPDSASSTE